MVVLLEPKLVGDTIWGRGAQDTAESRSGIAVSDIDWAMAQGHRFDGQKTVFGVVIPLTLWALAACFGGACHR
jgi:hypothetical protein